MINPKDINTWPPELRYRYEERVGIKMDNMYPPPLWLAEMDAMQETWEQFCNGDIEI